MHVDGDVDGDFDGSGVASLLGPDIISMVLGHVVDLQEGSPWNIAVESRQEPVFRGAKELGLLCRVPESWRLVG